MPAVEQKRKNATGWVSQYALTMKAKSETDTMEPTRK